MVSPLQLLESHISHFFFLSVIFLKKIGQVAKGQHGDHDQCYVPASYVGDGSKTMMFKAIVASDGCTFTGIEDDAEFVPGMKYV